MTIKIKAPIVMLTQNDVDIYLRHRGWLSQKQFRAVRESDWRKLMKLVRAVEGHCSGTYHLLGICEALAALEKKK